MFKIFVGNLPFSSSEDDIRNLFSAHGEVHSVKLINDRVTGRPRGFGFVEMDPENATNAIAALNSTELEGRTIHVNEAKQREPRTPRKEW